MRGKLLFILFLGLFYVNTSVHSQLLYLDSSTASYIDAASYVPKNNILVLFSGSSLLLYNVSSTKVTDSKWYQLQGFSKIQAALAWTEDEVLIFDDKGYQTFEVSTAKFIGEKKQWLGLPKEWNNTFDAVVRWDDGNVLFVKDDKFLIYNFQESNYTTYDYLNTWEGWPKNWKSPIEAIFAINNRIYFLNDGFALEYSKEKDTFLVPIEIGYSKK